MQNDGPGRHALSSLHSTWFAILHAVFNFTDTGRVTKEHCWKSRVVRFVRSKIYGRTVFYGRTATYNTAIAFLLTLYIYIYL
jgi:hypothetical protein